MSRLPELEQELVATAARLRHAPRRFERRARTLVPALALVCVVAVALVAGGLFDADDDAGVSGVRGGGAPAEAAPPFPPDATLEDMLAVFRRPQTEADDMGIGKDEMDEIPDRQPGEDFTASRRVEWPGARIFLWPKRDGVCFGVPGGSGCPPLEELRRRGVSIGYGYSRRGASVYGVVVDGVREVILTYKNGAEVRVPVRENFFHADVDAGISRVSWHYAGEERRFSLEGSFPDDTTPPPPEPRAGFEPVPGSDSDPLRFTAAGVSFTAVAYQSTNDMICMRVAEEQTERPALGCQNVRGVHDRLAEQPAELFASGGTKHGLITHKGFARADVVDVEAVERASETTVILSEPWTPAPWAGEPIRFLIVVARAPAERWPKLRVRLADGRSYLIES